MNLNEFANTQKICKRENRKQELHVMLYRGNESCMYHFLLEDPTLNSGTLSVCMNFLLQ